METSDRRDWWMIPGRKDVYAPRFFGTLAAAVAAATARAAHYQCRMYVHPDRTSDAVAPCDRVGPCVVMVSVPTSSPLRDGHTAVDCRACAGLIAAAMHNGDACVKTLRAIARGPTNGQKARGETFQSMAEAALDDMGQAGRV